MATSVPLGIVSLKAEGAYAADKLYKKGMWVTSSGSSYAYINSTPAAGVPVTDTTHWQQIASIGGQDLVDAAEAARDAAQGYKDAAANSAAQLQAGIGSPAKSYANLAAVNAANPAHDRTYLTENDWKIALWDEAAQAFVAGGVYQATAIADGSVAYAKLTKGGRFATIIPPTTLIPDYNTSTKILDFKSTTGNEPSLVYGLQTYVIPPGTTVSLDRDGTTFTTFKLLFNTATSVFRVVAWDAAIAEEEVIVAVGRNNTGNMWIGCKYTINGRGVALSDLPQGILGDAVITGKPTFSASVGSVVIGGLTRLYFVRNDGTLYKTSPDLTSQSWTLVQNEVLLWDLDANTIIVQNNTTARGANTVVLANWHDNRVEFGHLKPYYDSVASLSRVATIIPPKNTFIDYNTSTKILDFKSTTGNEPTLVYGSGYYVIPPGTTVDLSTWSTTFILLFDTLTKAFRAVPWSGVANPGEVIVASGRNHNGNMWIGCKYTINGRFPSTKSIPTTFIGKTKTMDSVNVSTQGLTVVGDEVWGFFPSLADHSNSANIYRWSVDGFVKKTNNFTHNLGHCASADYNAETDVLLTGNGESDNAVLPRIDLTVGARALCGEDAHALDIANAISIPFFTMSGETIVKQIGGAGCIACFGEEKSIVYVMTAQSAPRKIFRIQLGMGAVDYSDTVGTDVTKWGTFIPGKTVDEYNGTAKVLATYSGAEATVSQGMCFHDGHLFLCCGSSTSQVLKIKCLDDGSYDIVETFELAEYNSNGVRINHEPEGVCVYKGVYLLIGVQGTPKRMLIFPLYNKQVGKGTVGTRVVFDFPCNSVPTVMITPTTSTTDLYISNIDRLGFTVSSTNAGSGTFNWECPIS